MTDLEEKTKKRLERRKSIRGLCLLAVAFILVFSATSQGRRFWKEMFRVSGFGGDTGAPFSIHVLDVGKADAILIECQGHTALLDAGTSLHGETVVDYMVRNRIDSLDYAIVSHPDKDHIGGMAQVLSEVGAGEFIRSRYHSGEYSETEAVLRKKSIPERIVSSGDMLELGEAKLSVLGPLQNYSDTNNDSLVIRLEYLDFTALFCGDIEEEAEKDLVGSGADLTANLLKVPHHGSKTSCTTQFLEAVSPEYAVISVGRDNNKLPVEEVLRRLDGICLDVYRTDTDGTVVFTYDEKGFHVQTGN